MSVDGAADALLRWYDQNARTLPWRVASGVIADPYAVWLSEVMLQQTTVAAAAPYWRRFLERWPTVETLAAADGGELMAAWAGLGYYARARNLHACARAVATDHGGRFPDTEAGLRALPGIGAYTAAAVAAIAFGRRAVVVDANVERVVARLFAVKTPLPAARAEIYRLADRITPDAQAGDFAQAMMDLGATVCTVRRPACLACPLADRCAARATGDPAGFPRKAARHERPTRRAAAFWLERDDEVLLVRRPPEGLLGGMLALPTGPWTADDPALAGAPVEADWRTIGMVSHDFTHFRLKLTVLAAVQTSPFVPSEVGGRARDTAPGARASTSLGTNRDGDLPRNEDPVGKWWPVGRLEEAGLPTLFAKAIAVGLAVRETA